MQYVNRYCTYIGYHSGKNKEYESSSSICSLATLLYGFEGVLGSYGALSFSSSRIVSSVNFFI
jgi:hypothetical protein